MCQAGAFTSRASFTVSCRPCRTQCPSLMQVAAVCQENTELRAVVGTLKEAKANCEVGARANRETILRMVAEAREYESTLDKMTSLKQVHTVL